MVTMHPMVDSVLERAGDLMRILVVDDNVELAENVAELLEDEGHAITVAFSADQALLLLKEGADRTPCFDAALLDVRMDGMDGVELLGHLRRCCPSMTCVMMTAFSRDERLDTARELGARRVLAKPFAPDALLSALCDAA
ncbi:MAG: hypothetical protein CMN31_09335 [Sandaracinus sp.]|nr:hypothetical protein [Myxococcales bacterium]MAT29975.1 hypothetical protein [Sandaracinus sp.]MBJ71529.1 hypothetical protein [Sandaracinus sp.]